MFDVPVVGGAQRRFERERRQLEVVRGPPGAERRPVDVDVLRRVDERSRQQKRASALGEPPQRRHRVDRPQVLEHVAADDEVVRLVKLVDDGVHLDEVSVRQPLRRLVGAVVGDDLRNDVGAGVVDVGARGDERPHPLEVAARYVEHRDRGLVQVRLEHRHDAVENRDGALGVAQDGARTGRLQAGVLRVVRRRPVAPVEDLQERPSPRRLRLPSVRFGDARRPVCEGA